MKLSAPIYRLKGLARQRSRKNRIPLWQALDDVALAEGFRNWSHLAHAWKSLCPAQAVLKQAAPGSLVLLAARPGQGKTMLGLEIAATASRSGRRATFFSSECSQSDVRYKLVESGFDVTRRNGGPTIDLTDCVCARHIMSRLEPDMQRRVAVIDYLQVMDQDRREPPLGEQIAVLRQFARNRGHTIIFLSQVHRSFDPRKKPVPDYADLRTINPLDLSLFDAGWFLHDGELALRPQVSAS
ncbi:DNA helicase [Roseibium sp. Sym1]|uniref:DNA helicase n=1 Tax=Roseibium sp. Sym1 TaxID=3016006 RepID=UPI0022B47328|nr:DNA helicase [Roseibium sp. Sym1]